MDTTIDQKRLQQKRAKRKESGLAWLITSPYIIIFIIFAIVPVVLGIVFSFMKYNPYSPDTNEFIGFQNFINLFNPDLQISKTFWESFSTMLLFDIVAVPLLIIIPLFLAYYINMRPPGYKIFRAIIYLPSVVSVSIMGVIFSNMFAGDSSGLINAWLGTEIHWLGGKPWEGDTLRWLVILTASIWWQTGSNFIIFSGALRNVPKSLYEACEMDGGGKIKCFFSVTLPNIKSSITICLFNTLVGYLGLYGQTLALCDASNKDILVTPMMFIQKYLSGGVTYATQTGFFCACAILFGIVTIIFSTIQRVCCADRRKKTCFELKCNTYSKNKKLLAGDNISDINPELAKWGEL